MADTPGLAFLNGFGVLGKSFFTTLMIGIVSVMTFGCAAASPQASARSAYEYYKNHCDSETMQCPEAFPEPREFQLIASRPGVKWTNDGTGWKLDPKGMAQPGSPQLLVQQLKFAIKKNDIDAAKALFLPEALPADFPEWLSSYKANELYAALAANPAPWFELSGNQAICEVAGILVVLVSHSGIWRIKSVS